MSLDPKDKQQLIKHFTDTVSHYAKSNVWGLSDTSAHEKFLKYSFYSLIPKQLGHFARRRMRSKLKRALNRGHRFHSDWTIYDIEGLGSTGSPTDERSRVIFSHFCHDIMSIFKSDIIYHKMDSFGKSISPSVVMVQYKQTHKRRIGISLMALVFIISMIIPNHQINLVGLTSFKSVAVLVNFCVYQLKNLFNVALIGRVLINLICDIPLYKCFFKKGSMIDD